MSKAYSAKIKTGIESFDVLIPGGFRKNQNIVLSGPNGSGKTIFGLQSLYVRAKELQEPGVYVSANRSPDDIIEDCKMFGWDLKELITSGKLAIIDARPYKKEDGFGKYDENLYRGEEVPFEHLTQLILSISNKIHANCIVIDSLPILIMNYSNEFYVNQGIQNMLQTMEESQCACMIISDKSSIHNTSLENSLASGIVLFDIKDNYGLPRRTIQIIKLKGAFHSEDTYSIQLTDKGLEVMHSENK